MQAPTASVSQTGSQYFAERRRSTELFGVGGFFEGFNYVHSLRPLSIDSSIRLSQAATMVSADSTTITSRPSMSFLLASPPISQPVPRSRSPRPRSLPVGPMQALRLREQLGRESMDGRRSSADSTRAVRSLAVTGPQGAAEPATPALAIDDEDLLPL
ncbi:hypothetical protein K504DRAFT_497632 [Pleomassaria siparia CBS 279.74]|uniref:Uncharacterized protein n=1 Tax=Pleomassaria siparia CBS 279.74 TaxID=1314801 RepID=A0A6G1KTF5_9PLEO|nr:hypothetical protein K504DRAFT_497632 [Pleomassaria siparia CBS 279.74]